jgi:MoxR-like ATPase
METNILRGSISQKNPAYTAIAGEDGKKYYYHTNGKNVNVPDEGSRVVFRIELRGPGLDPLVYDVQVDSPTRIVEETERQISEQINLRIDELNQREISMASREAEFEKKLELLHQKEESIEMLVAERVTARTLELDMFEAQLKSREERIKEVKETLDKEQQKIEGEKKQLAAGYIKFRELGGEPFVKIFAEEHQVNITAPADNTPLPKKLPKEISSFFKKQGYLVEETISTQFLLSTLCAAFSGQFVVLSGPTGVGKTSMVNRFASALGAGHGVVPVRPSWIDPTDLLGFYNPQTGRYQASPFMDCLLEAAQYSEANRMYFLTLDEMNLSRVENYAADFLSRLEKARAGEENAKLQLYSDDIYQRLKKDLEKDIAARKSDEASLQLAGSYINKYPSRMEIPSGLVMFGTINLDETTHHLSPKFLDRSFVINIPTQELATQLSKAVATGGETQSFYEIPLASVKKLANGRDALPTDTQKIWEDVLAWQEEYIQPLGIRLGFRFQQAYVTYMKIAAELNVAPRAAASVFFQSKLFPWISFNRDERSATDSAKSKLEVLEEWAQDPGIADYPNEYGLQTALQGIVERSAGAIVVRYLE